MTSSPRLLLALLQPPRLGAQVEVESAPESSMKNFSVEQLLRPTPAASPVGSGQARRRAASSCPPGRAEASRRITSCTEGISSEKTATAFFSFAATWSAMFIASDVLPMPGRAASTISSPPCRPVSCSSRSMKPVDRPVMPVALLLHLVEQLERGVHQLRHRGQIADPLLLGDAGRRGARRRRPRLRYVAGVVGGELDDLAAHPGQLPANRPVLDDLGVLPRVLREGQALLELREVDRAAGRGELAPGLQLLCQGEGVDPRAARVEVDHRLEDLLVARVGEVVAVNDLGHLRDQLVVADDRAEHRPLRRQIFQCAHSNPFDDESRQTNPSVLTCEGPGASPPRALANLGPLLQLGAAPSPATSTLIFDDHLAVQPHLDLVAGRSS